MIFALSVHVLAGPQRSQFYKYDFICFWFARWNLNGMEKGHSKSMKRSKQSADKVRKGHSLPIFTGGLKRLALKSEAVSFLFSFVLFLCVMTSIILSWFNAFVQCSAAMIPLGPLKVVFVWSLLSCAIPKVLVYIFAYCTYMLHRVP